APPRRSLRRIDLDPRRLPREAGRCVLLRSEAPGRRRKRVRLMAALRFSARGSNRNGRPRLRLLRLRPRPQRSPDRLRAERNGPKGGGGSIEEQSFRVQMKRAMNLTMNDER